jgi:hypothetical protein
MSSRTSGDDQTDDAGGAPLRQNLWWSSDRNKGGMLMRYVALTLLVLGLGITAIAPVVSAQVNVPPSPSFTNQYGNQTVPLTPGGGGGAVCYMDGVAYSCTQPAPMTMPTPSGSGGVAGGSTVCPLIGPCYEPQYTPLNEPPHNPFYGGDNN